MQDADILSMIFSFFCSFTLLSRCSSGHAVSPGQDMTQQQMLNVRTNKE